MKRPMLRHGRSRLRKKYNGLCPEGVGRVGCHEEEVLVKRRVGLWGSAAVALVAVMGWAAPLGWAQTAGQLVLEDFRAKEADGFPSNWENESQRSEAKARSAYKVQADQNGGFLAVRDADQRIKKKKIDWDPKAYPVLTWRWRLHKAPASGDPLAILYVSLDTDFYFIPVFTKYVWSVSKPEGTLVEGGMFSGAEMVVQSGTKPLGEWVEEKVNVYQDFKRIHDHEPASKAWGISIFCPPGVEIDFGPIVASTQQ